MEYRRDIDGLRALAVGTVVLFHAFPSALPGGYVGVDVFFVISGFLITSIISREIQDNTFSIRRFYDRRFRRILPALLFILAITTIAGWFILPPPDFAEYGESLGAAATFLSNAYFWLTGGYFGGPAHEKALLHTWSLAVEEQFYVVWPLVLLVVTKFSQRWLFAFVAAVFAGSLFWAEIRLSEHPLEVFFGLHTRAWELLMGAAIALGLVPRLGAPRAAAVSVWLGLALILLSAILLQPDSRFPGLSALPACVGAALVLHYGGQTRAADILRIRPIVFVGLVSYSLYLWHWPVLVLGRIALGEPPTVVQTLSLLALAFLGAVVSWRFIERPFRRSGPEKLRIGYFVRPIGALALVGSAGAAILLTGGAEFRARDTSLDYASVSKDFNPRRSSCLANQYSSSVASRDGCIFGEGEPSILVWGDSHADALTPGVEAWAGSYELTGRQMTKSACPPLLGVTLVTRAGAREGCAAANLQTLQVIEDMQPRFVILAARWPRYVENAATEGEDAGEFFLTDGAGAIDQENSRRVFSIGLRETVRLISEVAPAATVIILGPLPEWKSDPVRCAVRRSFHGRPADICFEQPRSEFDGRTGGVADAIRAALSSTKAQVVWPQAILCDASVCRATLDGQLLYRDDDHLSATGATSIGPSLFALGAIEDHRTSQREVQSQAAEY